MRVEWVCSAVRTSLELKSEQVELFKHEGKNPINAKSYEFWEPVSYI